MEIALTALADSANVSREGKLNILGIFDSINAETFPAMHPAMTFAFRMLMEAEDANKTINIEVTLIDEDARPLWGAKATMRTGPIAPGEFAHLDQVINLQGVTFPRAGRYRFRIRLQGIDDPYDTVFQVGKGFGSGQRPNRQQRRHGR